MTVIFDKDSRRLLRIEGYRGTGAVPNILRLSAKNWFIVMGERENNQVLKIGNQKVFMPKDWLGKKVRIRIEEITNESIVQPKSTDELFGEMWKKKPREEYAFDEKQSHIFMCATCKNETECLLCSECGFFYCKKHISLQEVGKTLCDSCYAKFLKSKITAKDVTPEQEIMNNLKRLGAKNGSME